MKSWRKDAGAWRAEAPKQRGNCQRTLVSMLACLGLGMAGLKVSGAEDHPADAGGQRWTVAQAWDWYQRQPWALGFNYVPSTAANTTEFWAAETFDEATIRRELGWARATGFNSCRVFVQYLVWQADPEGLLGRVDRFLRVAAEQELSVVLVLFDDCAFGDPVQTEPYLGRQRDPIPGMILPSWTPSPGLKAVEDRGLWPGLERYVRAMVGRFGQDARVWLWDLYNEPGNSGLGNRSLPLVEATFAWARAMRPAQPLTVGVWGAPEDISRRQRELSDVVSFHFYGPYDGLRAQIARFKAEGRPVINTEWMARPLGSQWATDLPLFRREGVGAYSWGLVNGRTQCQFAWYHRRGTPEPEVWFHDLFHGDGRPYDSAEPAVIRGATMGRAAGGWGPEYAAPRASEPNGRRRPVLLYGDATRHGRPFAKDPSVLRWQGRYLMYYSMAPSTNRAAPRGWAIGVAQSRDLERWEKVAEILPEQPCETNGLVNGKALVLDGRVHLFYNTYGNGRDDALCHAVSEDGLRFRRDPSNPIVRATGAWNSGRAIDCDAFEHEDQLFLLFATRDPSMERQMLAVAAADRRSDFGRGAWRQLGSGPVLAPELPWEKRCIEAPSVIARGQTLYLFYGGGYNNDPQQIGCATSQDGVVWKRLFSEPLLPHGQPGDWNESETGHPGVFLDDDGRTYLFVQGNKDRGRTWYLSAFELGWREGLPEVRWDSPKFPAQRPGPAAHSEGGMAFGGGWTCWRGPGPEGGGLHYAATAGTIASWESEGETLSWVHKVGPDCGVARFEIDGDPARVGEIDTYAPEVEWNRRTVLAQGLGKGKHRVVLTVTGRRNERSTGAYVQIVRP